MEFITTRDSLKMIEESGKVYLFAGMDLPMQAVFMVEKLPAILHQSLQDGISWHIRSELSIERSILSPGNTYPWVAVLMALGTIIVYPDGKTKDIVDYMKQRTSAAGAPDGILIPLSTEQTRICYQAVRPTPANLPTVSVCTVITVAGEIVKDARIALTGTFKNKLGLVKCADAMIGKPFTQTLIQQTVDALMAEIQPVSNFQASADYRKEMAKSLTEHALQACLQGEGA